MPSSKVTKVLLALVCLLAMMIIPAVNIQAQTAEDYMTEYYEALDFKMGPFRDMQGKPLQGGTVSLSKGKYNFTSEIDEEGMAEFSQAIPFGTYTVEIRYSSGKLFISGEMTLDRQFCEDLAANDGVYTPNPSQPQNPYMGFFPDTGVYYCTGFQLGPFKDPEGVPYINGTVIMDGPGTRETFQSSIDEEGWSDFRDIQLPFGTYIGSVEDRDGEVVANFTIEIDSEFADGVDSDGYFDVQDILSYGDDGEPEDSGEDDNDDFFNSFLFQLIVIIVVIIIGIVVIVVAYGAKKSDEEIEEFLAEGSDAAFMGQEGIESEAEIPPPSYDVPEGFDTPSPAVSAESDIGVPAAGDMGEEPGDVMVSDDSPLVRSFESHMDRELMRYQQEGLYQGDLESGPGWDGPGNEAPYPNSTYPPGSYPQQPMSDSPFNPKEKNSADNRPTYDFSDL